ncbi:heterokaryon incompatibility protein-domain-containing protein [Clohesyomyces aquaticus]|uniref:Heterokaryon incompatibility protein-domain-containing protein n=1 Tax=Clohesyomyces aquaticus TaxID=1231657 RepID=A0A1Y1YCT5_9PLEO|nr:heterokaryon incompatibility protein-domain-containing protein [Clohesyomyces aquaticus]
MESSTFQHKPLDKTKPQIRLFRIELRKEVISDEAERTTNYSLYGTLEVFEFPECPPFRALSYMWGTDPPGRTIVIDGHEVRIRDKSLAVSVELCLSAHLWRSLWNYVYPHKVPPENAFECDTSDFAYQGSNVYLWIDGICIDQSNIAERNHQVRQMSEIYKTAVEVIIWLGVPEDESLVSFFRLLKSDPERAWQEWNGDWFGLPGNVYWERLWIVQEVLLARHLTVMSGPHLLPWKRLDEFYEDVISSDGDSHPSGDYLGLSFAALVSYRRDRPVVGNLSLRGAIVNFCSNHCFEPRDKIFGLLGIVHPEDRITVDYGMTRLQVFRAVAEVIIRKGKDTWDDRQNRSCLYTLYVSMVPETPSGCDYRAFEDIIADIKAKLLQSRLVSLEHNNKNEEGNT